MIGTVVTDRIMLMIKVMVMMVVGGHGGHGDHADGKMEIMV